MLIVTVDIFSGRPNPTVVINDPDVVERVVGVAAENPAVLASPGRGTSGLGFREVVVTQLEDDPRGRRVPQTFALASTAAEDFKASAELARFLIEQLPRYTDLVRPEHELTPVTKELVDRILTEFDRHVAEVVKAFPFPRFRWNPRITTTRDPLTQCTYEISQFNPAFWNAPTVQPHNNCYNYGRNWRTDTFAQPGRAHGAMYTSLTSAAVLAAAHADGLVDRGHCLPDSEYPRRLVALVIAPGWDFHWYRHQRSGFWGHKPGSTAARNFDNSGVLITNPETADRGPYTEFAGYLYAGRSVVIS
jgi:hypothetical protein